VTGGDRKQLFPKRIRRSPLTVDDPMARLAETDGALRLFEDTLPAHAEVTRWFANLGAATEVIRHVVAHATR